MRGIPRRAEAGRPRCAGTRGMAGGFGGRIAGQHVSGEAIKLRVVGCDDDRRLSRLDHFAANHRKVEAVVDHVIAEARAQALDLDRRTRCVEGLFVAELVLAGGQTPISMYIRAKAASIRSRLFFTSQEAPSTRLRPPLV